MKKIFVSRVDNFVMGKKRSVAFTLDLPNDDYYNLSELNDLRKDLDFLTTHEEKFKGISQSKAMDNKGVSVMLDRTVAQNALEFSAIYIKSDEGLLSLESFDDAQAMCNMIESVLLNEDMKE